MAVGDVPASPRVFQSIAQAWTNMWPSFWILLAFSIIEMLLQAPAQIGELFPDSMWQLGLVFGALGLLFTFLIGGPLGMGVVKAHLATSHAQKPEFSVLGYGFSRYWEAVLATVLSFLIVAAGFIFLIIPGIYLGVRLSFVAHRFVNDELGAMDAIKASWEDTQGRWWRTFGLALMALALFFAGLLALGVGALVAIVLIEQMITVYWRSINKAEIAPVAVGTA